MIGRRGDGIGLEITTSVVRGVRLDQDEPGRVAAACEVPIERFDDGAAVLDALVRVRARLGTAPLPTRVGFFPPGSTMQRTDVTGLGGPELNRLRHRLADDVGVTSTMLVDVEARRWMFAMRWDHHLAWWIEELVERAGFVDVTVEPAPVALQRVLAPDVTVARRDPSSTWSWAVVLDRSPVAASGVEPDGREHPGLAVSTATVGLTALDQVLDQERVAEEVALVVSTKLGELGRRSELDARLRIVDDPYPPFPSHDLRAPQRVAVALGSAVGAAGLAGRTRAVDVLSAVRPDTDSIERPWAVERIAAAAPDVASPRRSRIRTVLRWVRRPLSR